MEIINQIHSIARWAILVLAILAIFKSLSGMMSKSAYGTTDNKLSLLLVSLCDIQLLIGLVQYFVGPWGLKNIQNQGMAMVMKDGYSRFFAVEHILMMIIAIALIHVGRVKTKKASTDLSKHKNTFWFTLIAFVIMLASIPWPFKKGFEALGWI